MTRDDERGRVVLVPVSLAGLVLMWAVAVVLLLWDTVGGPDMAGQWGLLASAGAAAWTVLYGLACQRDLLRRAFDMGREVGSEGRPMQPVRGGR